MRLPALAAALALCACRPAEPPPPPAPPRPAGGVKPLDPQRAFEAATTFVQAVSRGDEPAAYSLLDDEYRAAVPLERFRAGVAHNPYLHEIRSVKMNQVEGLGEAGELTVLLLRAPGKTDVIAHLHFAGAGSITGATVAGLPALPAPQ